MTAVIAGHVTPSAVRVFPDGCSDSEWLTARRSGIGGSDVGAIIGASRYKGPLSVYLDKLGMYEQPDNDAMRWGRRFEPALVEEFVELHPELRLLVSPGLVRHVDDQWRLATVDALLSSDDTDTPAVLFEAKTAVRRAFDADGWGRPGTDEIPFSYLCQVLWYLDILGLKVAYVGVLILDERLFLEYRVEHDAATAAALRQHCAPFWFGNVLAGVAPEPDALESTTKALEAQHRPVADLAVQLPAAARELARAYWINHQTAAEAEERKAEAANQFRALLLAGVLGPDSEPDGTPMEGRVGEERVCTWKPVGPAEQTITDWDALAEHHPQLTDQYRTELDRAAFAADHPELVAEYSTTTPLHKYRLTVAKGL